nr:hypothetical protein [Nostoc sp. ChiSLP03a]
MQPPLRPERAHDYSSAKYPQLDNPQLGLFTYFSVLGHLLNF